MEPVVVPGWQRDFDLSILNPAHYRCRRCRGVLEGVAAADAQPSRGARMAAVAIAVDEAQLRACDRREQTYMRVQVMRLPGLPGIAWVYQGRKERRKGARLLPLGYWQKMEQAAEIHPYGEMILGDKPDIPMPDLEFVRYLDAEPEGICRCL